MRKMMIIAAALIAAGCNQEKRVSDLRAAVASPPMSPRTSELIPGGYLPIPTPKNPFENNQQAIQEGQQLWNNFNCSGCHSTYGGGAIGPPLIDDKWIYGSEAANIFETIVKGRPNGMPSFAGKIPEYQIWQLVTFVQSLPKSEPASSKRKQGQVK